MAGSISHDLDDDLDDELEVIDLPEAVPHVSPLKNLHKAAEEDNVTDRSARRRLSGVGCFLHRGEDEV